MCLNSAQPFYLKLSYTTYNFTTEKEPQIQVRANLTWKDDTSSIFEPKSQLSSILHMNTTCILRINTDVTELSERGGKMKIEIYNHINSITSNENIFGGGISF